ncbi:hypothetical protein [Pseudomonas kilonensis]
MELLRQQLHIRVRLEKGVLIIATRCDMACDDRQGGVVWHDQRA